MQDVRKLLEQANFFRGLSPGSKDAIAAICRPQPLRQKEVLFHEGEPGRSVYLLATGHVRLSRTSPDGKEAVIKIVQPGEIFAEVILFEANRYPVTATAAGASLVLAMPRLQMHELLERREFRTDFLAMLMRKQRYLAERIYLLTASGLEERFFRFLEEHYGRVQTAEVVFRKKEIAAAIGATPEAFSRLILRLKRRRRLRWNARTLQLPPDFWNKRH
jgi:CRP/FNR family transcriptional regulator